MAISLVRIDDRLIHGQVVEGWLRQINSTCLVVASDMVANDFIQRTVMELAVPAKVKVVIDEVGRVVERINNREFDADEVILLFSRPEDMLSAMEMGLKCERLNVGGLHYRPGTRQIADALCVEPCDVKAFLALVEKGVQVYFQALPDERPVDIMQVIDKPWCEYNL